MLKKNQRYLKPFKVVKRVLFDLPIDSCSWITFYLGRRKNDFSTYSDLECEGVQALYGVLNKEDIQVLEEVSDEQNLFEKLNQRGQQRGRSYSQGLIDDRLRGITEKFRAIAAVYLNTPSIKLELTYFQLSQQIEDIQSVPGGEYHMDDNKPNLKFFVYLTDVGKDSGPFRVVPDTHGLRLNKIVRYLKWSLLKHRSNLYCATGEFARLDEASVSMVGDKGFCFVADTTAWHRADAVQAGQRSVFVASFNCW